MKKKEILILVFSLGMALSFGASVFAQEDMQGMGNESERSQSQTMGGQGKGKMMGMMHKDSMIATSDGGIVVMSGPRLIKYDGALNLVKEVELPKEKKRSPSEMKNEQANSEASAPAVDTGEKV